MLRTASRLVLLLAAFVVIGPVVGMNASPAAAQPPRYVLEDDHQGTWPPCTAANDGEYRMIQGGLYRCTAYWDPQYRVWIYYWERVTCGIGKAATETSARTGDHDRRWTSRLEPHKSSP
jgi:hypothetical protein